MTIHMLHDADVLCPVKTTLRSFGVRGQDLAEGVAEVQTRTLEYLQGKAMPTKKEEWAALCVTIARSWQLDEKKRRKTARKYCDGLCEEPDERGLIEWGDPQHDIADARRMLRELGAQLDAGEMPERADEILDCVQADMKLTEIGAELGISASAVGKRLTRIRELFRARLGALGITVMTVLLLTMLSSPAIAASVGALERFAWRTERSAHWARRCARPTERRVSPEQRCAAPDQRVVLREERSAAATGRCVLRDERRVLREERCVRRRERSAFPAERHVLPDQRCVALAQRFMDSMKRFAGATQHCVGVTERRVRPAERSVAATRRSAGPTRRSIGATERSVGTTKRRVATTERSAPATERSSRRAQRSVGAASRSSGITQRSMEITERCVGTMKR